MLDRSFGNSTGAIVVVVVGVALSRLALELAKAFSSQTTPACGNTSSPCGDSPWLLVLIGFDLLKIVVRLN